MDHSPRSTTLTPSSTTTAMTPNLVSTLTDQAMDQTPDSPVHGSTREELPTGKATASSIASSGTTVPVRPPRPPADIVELDDVSTQTGTQEPIIISVEPEREPSLSPSEVTSASESPWRDGTYLRSPMVEVEELDGMEEDEILADSITVVGDDPERSVHDERELFTKIARELALGLYDGYSSN